MKTWFHRLFLAGVLVCVSHSAFANTCNGTTGNWGTAGTWTSCGGVAPTSADSCTFSGSGTITVESAVAGTDVCGATDFTGFTGTLTHASAKELDIYGSLTIVSGMTYIPNSGAILKLKGTSSFTLATGGKNIPPMTVDGVGGTYTLQDTFATTTGLGNSGITITNGCFVTNNNTVTASLSSSNSNTRCLTLGSSTWNLNGVGVTGLWDITTPTNMTLSAASSTIVNPQTAAAVTFNGGGLTYGTITDTAQTTAVTTIGNLSATTLTLSQGASSTGNYKLSGNITVSGTCTGNGNSVVNRDWITSDTKGTARTFSCGTSTFTNADFQDITAAGAATWSLAAITGGSGNCGGNTNITFTTPISAYHKTAVSDNWTGANWYTASGGSTPISPQQFPLCQDTAVFDANSVTAGSKTITIDASAVRVSAMNWTGVANTPALAFTTAASYFGSITLVSGMTVSGTATITLDENGSKTITTAGQTITPLMVVDSGSGTWSQADNLTDNKTGGDALRIKSGTYKNNGFTTTLSGASGTLGNSTPGGTFKVSGTVTGPAAFISLINFGSIAPDTGYSFSVSSTAITASSSSGGGSCSFGDAGQWRDWNEANDNVRYRRAM